MSSINTHNIQNTASCSMLTLTSCYPHTLCDLGCFSQDVVLSFIPLHSRALELPLAPCLRLLPWSSQSSSMSRISTLVIATQHHHSRLIQGRPSPLHWLVCGPLWNAPPLNPPTALVTADRSPVNPNLYFFTPAPHSQ